jgi:hypothetical protein
MQSQPQSQIPLAANAAPAPAARAPRTGVVLIDGDRIVSGTDVGK